MNHSSIGSTTPVAQREGQFQNPPLANTRTVHTKRSVVVAFGTQEGRDMVDLKRILVFTV